MSKRDDKGRKETIKVEKRGFDSKDRGGAGRRETWGERGGSADQTHKSRVEHPRLGSNTRSTRIASFPRRTSAALRTSPPDLEYPPADGPTGGGGWGALGHGGRIRASFRLGCHFEGRTPSTRIISRHLKPSALLIRSPGRWRWRPRLQGVKRGGSEGGNEE